MSLPISTATAEHYTWGAACDGWHLLRSAELSVIQERVPPGAGETRHAHSRSRQFFYILEGEAILEVAGQRHQLPARTGLEIAPGVAHQFRNESRADVVFLVISQPPSQADRQPAEPLEP
jgi:uncharacterized cupin superfamily protein